MGVSYPSPIGLAAGLDKDGCRPCSLAALGFGFLELGTVTPRPQPGNPPPRLFRHPRALSLENRMGFNNAGSARLAGRLARRRPSVPIWVNLGKNRETLLERATDDYLAAARPLRSLVEAFVVNLSSPNTPGLRTLQSEEFLRRLGREVVPRLEAPVLVKLSPDLPRGQAGELAVAALDQGAAGVVLSNTTTDYSLLASARGDGGLSGRVLAERSFRQLQEVAAAVPAKAVLVSVGGVDRIQEVERRLDAGASLVQLYTGLIYEGPGLVRRLERELLELLERRGIDGLNRWPRSPRPVEEVVR